MSAEKPRPKATCGIVDEFSRLKRNLLKSETELDRLKARNLKLVEAMKSALHTDYFGCDCYSCSVLRAAIEENSDGK